MSAECAGEIDTFDNNASPDMKVERIYMLNLAMMRRTRIFRAISVKSEF